MLISNQFKDIFDNIIKNLNNSSNIKAQIKAKQIYLFSNNTTYY